MQQFIHYISTQKIKESPQKYLAHAVGLTRDRSALCENNTLKTSKQVEESAYIQMGSGETSGSMAVMW
jgi:hypothetical protein